ncbi:unnamed protein product [Leptidea sinapis]|uniref:HEAT repeat-containing protein 6 n=1 Tax=Leptidea sinapis TaxID=189913 RepID=A0A5E4Q2A4_9NEOP|nr:unnamed protein product [Leptidea sinapis]
MANLKITEQFSGICKKLLNILTQKESNSDHLNLMIDELNSKPYNGFIFVKEHDATVLIESLCTFIKPSEITLSAKASHLMNNIINKQNLKFRYEVIHKVILWHSCCLKLCSPIILLDILHNMHCILQGYSSFTSKAGIEVVISAFAVLTFICFTQQNIKILLPETIGICRYFMLYGLRPNNCKPEKIMPSQQTVAIAPKQKQRKQRNSAIDSLKKEIPVSDRSLMKDVESFENGFDYQPASKNYLEPPKANNFWVVTSDSDMSDAESNRDANKKVNASFIPFSVSLGYVVSRMHDLLNHLLNINSSVVESIVTLKCCAALVQATPYTKMDRGLAMDLVDEVLQSIQKDTAKETKSNKESETPNDDCDDFEEGYSDDEVFTMTELSQEQAKFRFNTWILDICFRNLGWICEEKKMVKCSPSTIPVMLESLQVLSAIAYHHLAEVLKPHIMQVADILCEILGHDHQDVVLHTVKLISVIGDAIQKLERSNSAPPLNHCVYMWEKLLTPLSLVLQNHESSPSKGVDRLQRVCCALLMGLCSDEESSVRAAAVRALAMTVMYRTLREPLCETAIKKLLDCACKVSSMKVRWNACYALGNAMKNECLYTCLNGWQLCVTLAHMCCILEQSDLGDIVDSLVFHVDCAKGLYTQLYQKLPPENPSCMKMLQAAKHVTVDLTSLNELQSQSLGMLQDMFIWDV